MSDYLLSEVMSACDPRTQLPARRSVAGLLNGDFADA